MSSAKLKQTFNWDMDSTIWLINLYEENECLYNNTHKDYNNLATRQACMLKIASEIEEKMGKSCSVTDVRDKVNMLRSQYSFEKQKILKCGTAEEHSPMVYWFPMLQFLDSYSDWSQNPDSPLNCVPTDMSSPKSLEDAMKEPPKPPKRRKKYSGDSMSIANFSVNTTEVAKSRSDNPANHPHISAFCDFLKSELICIKQSGGQDFVKKAKRKLQLTLFEVWDDLESAEVE